MANRYLIIGGAGFIGSNTAAQYLVRGSDVTVFDNFQRKGSEHNAQWLETLPGGRLQIVRGDIRHDVRLLQQQMEESDVVLHLAAQVAVTTSVTDPREDFEINALGTFNVLECLRASRKRPVLIYSSTNKVYGKMEDLHVVEIDGRYAYREAPHGVSEERPLDFHSPYGCSKGCGDQYVLDYARIYGLRTVVFRQSCIYGPRQFGLEDQGWLAWFAIRAMQNLPVTIYGDGKQVRDVLYIDDLVRAYDMAVASIGHAAGHAFNIGGGHDHTLSVLEALDLLKEHFEGGLSYSFDNWRPGDQLVFVSNINKARQMLGWEPSIRPADGVARLTAWLKQNSHLFEDRSRAKTMHAGAAA